MCSASKSTPTICASRSATTCRAGSTPRPGGMRRSGYPTLGEAPKGGDRMHRHAPLATRDAQRALSSTGRLLSPIVQPAPRYTDVKYVYRGRPCCFYDTGYRGAGWYTCGTHTCSGPTCTGYLGPVGFNNWWVSCASAADRPTAADLQDLRAAAGAALTYKPTCRRRARRRPTRSTGPRRRPTTTTMAIITTGGIIIITTGGTITSSLPPVASSPPGAPPPRPSSPPVASSPPGAPPPRPSSPPVASSSPPVASSSPAGGAHHHHYPRWHHHHRGHHHHGHHHHRWHHHHRGHRR